MKKSLPAFIILMLAVLACSIPGVPTDTGPIVIDPVVTDTTEPGPPVYTGPLPSGFVAATDTTSISFFFPDGTYNGNLFTGDLGYIGPQSLHVAGGNSGGIPPVVYFTWRDGTGKLILNTGGVETVLLEQPEFFRLGGAPGTPFLVYTTATYSDLGLLTRMVSGTPANIASVAPVIDERDPGGFALKPLALRLESDAVTGIWYTGCMYGIGGDLVFDPCNRLFFLDLYTGGRTELVGDGYIPSGLSPDHTWMAYARLGGGNPLIIGNLGTGASVTFPAWAENDRGSGDGVFSPDNNYVAWMEASGERMGEVPTFHSIVRVGTTAGVVLGEYPSDYFSTISGFPVRWVSPAAWLDNGSILIQTGGLEWTQNALIRLDLAGNLTYFTNGTYLGLTYP